VLAKVARHQFISHVELHARHTSTVQAKLVLWFATFDKNADAKQILNASASEDWNRPPFCPQVTWIKRVLDDLKSHKFLSCSVMLERDVACLCHVLVMHQN